MLVALLSWPILYGLYRLRAKGKEHLPQSGFVLAANHNSNFDPWPLGVPLFPRRYLRFMAKSELFWTPFKQFANAAGAFPVRRGESDLAASRPRRGSAARGTSSSCSPRGRDARKACGSATSRRRIPVPPNRPRCRSAAHPGRDRRHRSARPVRAAPCRVRPSGGVDDLAGSEDAPRLATERLMGAIAELERSA